MSKETVKTLLVLVTIAIFSTSWAIAGHLSQYADISENIKNYHIGRLVLDMIGGIVSLSVIYYCAFRKPGTKCLAFFIFLSSVAILEHVYAFGIFRGISTVSQMIGVQEGQIFAMMKEIQWFNFLNILILSGWIFFALKLWRFNRATQIQEILKIGTYQEIVHKLQSIENLSNLETKYYESIVEYPSIAWFLKRIYKDRKLTLQSIPAAESTDLKNTVS